METVKCCAIGLYDLEVLSSAFAKWDFSTALYDLGTAGAGTQRFENKTFMKNKLYYMYN